ncbi:MAG: hypothetical protein AAF599_13635 [Bacteroidota bacterium]
MQKKEQDQQTDQEDEIVEVLHTLRKERMKRKRLQSKLSSLVEEFQMVDTLLDELAGSLGACPSCWGSDTDCGYCHGEGKPGSYTPDKKLFRTYVLPVLNSTPWLRQILIKELQN